MKFLSYKEFLNEAIKHDKWFDGDNLYLYGITAWVHKLEPCDILFLLLHADETVATKEIEARGFYVEDSNKEYDLTVAFRNPDDETFKAFEESYSIIATGNLEVTVEEAKYKGDYYSPPDPDEIYVDDVSVDFTFYGSDSGEIEVKTVPPNYGYTIDDLNNMMYNSVLSRIENADLRGVKEQKVPTEIPEQLVERIKKAFDDKEVHRQIAKWIAFKKLPMEAAKLFPENQRGQLIRNVEYGL